MSAPALLPLRTTLKLLTCIFLAAAILAFCCQVVLAEAPYPIAWEQDYHYVTWDEQTGFHGKYSSKAITVAPSGDIFVTGATSQIPSSGGFFYLDKLDSSGNLLWNASLLTQLETPLNTRCEESGLSVAADTNGNAYVAGYTTRDLVGQIGGKDFLLLKYDGQGNEQWARQFGRSDTDVLKSVAVSNSGAVFVAGSTFNSYNHWDQRYLAKFDEAGSKLWSYTGNSIEMRSVAIAPDENIVIAGSTASAEKFIWKLNPSTGDPIYQTTLTTTRNFTLNSLAVDTAGNTYVAGDIDANVDGHLGNSDIFLAKFDSAGNQVWTRQFGSGATEWSCGLCVDASGNVFVGSVTNGDLFGPMAIGYDYAIVKYDPDGNIVWTERYGTEDDDFLNSMALDAQGNLYVIGDNYDTSPNGCYTFLIKYEAPEPTSLCIIAGGAIAALLRRRSTFR